MKHSKEYLLKPTNNPREIKFYKFINSTRNPDLEELKKYIPVYDGTATFRLHGEGENGFLKKFMPSLTENKNSLIFAYYDILRYRIYPFRGFNQRFQTTMCDRFENWCSNLGTGRSIK